MDLKDPKIVTLQFNEYINNQDINRLTNLMTEDHTFIGREGEVDKGWESITKGWINFFNQFPAYKNVFTRIELRNNLVILIGYAKWTKESKNDHAIWTAKIENDIIAEWRIYHDTEESRRKFSVI